MVYVMNPGGYGRTDDGTITCPRATTQEPCAARDGADAMTNTGTCQHCEQPVVMLYMTLHNEVQADEIAAARTRTATKFAALVHQVTEA